MTGPTERDAVITRAEQTCGQYHRHQRKEPQAFLGGAAMAYLRDVPPLLSLVRSLEAELSTAKAGETAWARQWELKQADWLKAEAERDTLKAEREARIELRVPFEISGRLGIGR